MTRSKSLILGGAALTATLAFAAFAQTPPDGPRMPQTRAELQTQIADHFNAADTNKDGFVTKAEFDAGREAMRAKFEAKREEHRAEMFATLDKDRNGSLSKDEFTAPRTPGEHDMPPPPPGAGRDSDRDGPHHGRHMRGHRGGMGMPMGGKWFDTADANKDGKLTLAEASARPLAMFDSADTNKDGKISPEEHKAAFEAMRAKWKRD
ncbi:MAG: hypothetical protein JWR77_1794 [Rhizorhabdus sp.]|nr:hypothetical protein [Rhizorhabdus sp.]